MFAVPRQSNASHVENEGTSRPSQGTAEFWGDVMRKTLASFEVAGINKTGHATRFEPLEIVSYENRLCCGIWQKTVLCPPESGKLRIPKTTFIKP
jgi:hypothetical protein